MNGLLGPARAIRRNPEPRRVLSIAATVETSGGQFEAGSEAGSGRACGRAFGDVYTPSKEWAARHPGAALATKVALGLLGGAFIEGRPSSATQQVFYRAYRIVPAAPPPVDVQNVNVPADQREELASAPDLATQLQVAHLLVATSAIDVSAYEALRAHLLSGLPSKGPSRPGDM